MNGPRGCSGAPTSSQAAGATKHLPRNLVWERSASLVSAERGDLLNEYIEITEDEANQIVERIRTTVTGANNG